jgi:adenylate cyclase
MKKWMVSLVAAAAAVAVAVGLETSGLARFWEWTLSDWRARVMAKPSEATGQVKLVLVDQASLDWASAEMGLSWPWPREVYGVVVDYLARCGAKAVALDILFTEPSSYGPGDDASLGDALARNGGAVAAVFPGTQPGRNDRWPDAAAQANPMRLEGSIAALNAPSAAFPVEALASSAAWLGSVRDRPDGDGVFRRSAPMRTFDGRPLPSLGLACALAGETNPPSASLAGLKEKPWRNSGGILSFGNGSAPIPLDADGCARLRFRGPSGVHAAYSAAAVIQSELCLREGLEPPIPDGAALFGGKYVVVGFSAPGLKDLRRTPMGGDSPGCELHATLIDDWLAGDFLRDPPHAAGWLWTVALAVLAALATAAARDGIESTAVWIVAALAPFAVGFAAWRWAGLEWPMAVPMAASVSALALGAMVNYLFEGRQKRFLKGAFRHYLSPAVVEQILRHPDRLRLGGERRVLSIFFSDLQGFSGFSERLSPEDLTGLLNDYLSDMTDIILEEGGTLDKYEGDAIIAFWGAPLDQPDHAERAVRAAVRCQRRLAERRDEWAERYGAVLRMRIGINTGPVVVGNMGSSQRFDYTMLGDAANLASRLEGANKALGTYLMVSESAWEATGGVFPGRELGTLRVVGRKTPVRVFEATGLPGEEAREDARPYEAALALMREGRWAEAAKAFAALGDEPAAKTHAARCAELAASGAAADAWDGIWNLDRK